MEPWAVKFGQVALKFAGLRFKLRPENISFAGSCLSLGPGGLKFGQCVLKFAWS